MRRASGVALLAAGLIALGAGGFTQARAAGSQPAPGSASPPRAFLDQYCVTCHNQRLQTADLTLDTLSVTRVGAGAEVWEKVVRKLRAGAMPPVGRPRPEHAEYSSFVGWLETQLDLAAGAEPYPGRTPIFHRLNRIEYENAIRDLLGIDIDASSMLPGDHAAFGFDNIADLLKVSPDLLDAYLSAANKISRLAVGDPATRLGSATYEVSKSLLQSDRMGEDLPFGSRGGVSVRHYFPYDGEYVVEIRFDGRPLDGPETVELRVDDVRVATLESPGRNYDQPPTTGAVTARVVVGAGPRVVGVSFVKETLAPESRYPEYFPWGNSAIAATATGGNRFLTVQSVEIAGPFEPVGPGDTPSRRRIFACRPSNHLDAERCATEILAGLARLAYRRPISDDDVNVLMRFYRAGRDEGEDFDGGIQAAIERLLMDPNFLFRVVREPTDVAPGGSYRLSDLELASRLSFFLWSSLPDDELLGVAERGVLRDPAVLEQQVRRMLADERSRSLVNNFAAQWLYLRNVRMAKPDPFQFPDWDENLRAALTQETELFLESQLREDRSVIELLTANYTFLNERLAQHYGMSNVYGSHFRRVALDDARRTGLLGHASILLVTSYPDRTSPVVRGKWLLENLLNYAPPPPPPNVNTALAPDQEGQPPRSMRERMEQHRRNPACAGCHAVMDPLGFSLENYDAIGAWRTTANSVPVDASGALPDGTKFEGPSGLRDVILSRRDEFVMTVTQKLLTYALGRGLEYYDMPVVRRIVRDAAAADYRWSAVVRGIAESAAFQMNTRREEP